MATESVTHRLALVAALLAVTVGLAGCGAGKRSEPGAPSGYSVGGKELTESEFRYGLAPQQHKDVTFQPDVVLVGGGAAAVRSVTADGLTWTIDAEAGGARDLAPGKVMFVTSRAVGRVIDVKPDGDKLAVTIGPVELTEVIKDGTFSGDQPVALDNVVSYSSEGSMWTDVSTSASQPPAVTASSDVVLPAVQFMGGGRRQAKQPDQPRVEQPRPVVGPPKSTQAAGFKITPICCQGGVGAHLTYDDNEIRAVATVSLDMRSPSARFHLAIAGGKVSVAELEINGGVGFKVDVAAASKVGTARQLNKTFAVPIDFSVPVGLVLGIPFSLTSNQWVIVRTAFSAKDGNLKGSGEYSFSGKLGFGYRDGSFGVHAPGDIGITKSLIDSLEGVSVGVNGMVLAYSARFYLGIGAFGFTAGLFFGMTVSTGITVGSSLGIIKCREATLTVNVNYGIGYTMPQLAVDVVNFFLKVFKAKPLERSGGPRGSKELFNKSQAEPQGCK